MYTLVWQIVAQGNGQWYINVWKQLIGSGL